MAKAITLRVSHPNLPAGKIADSAYRFIWAFYVNGFRPEHHCQECFKGSPVEGFSTPTAISNKTYEFDRMDRYPFVYVCGVGKGPKSELRHQNLHMPLKYKEGGVVEITTCNGYVFHADNAELVPIPEPEDGWRDLGPEFTDCKNFRFGKANFPPLST